MSDTEELDVSVDKVRVAAQCGRHTRFLEPLCICLALIPKGIETGRRDVGGRKSGQLLRLQRGQARVGQIGAFRDVLPLEPGDVLVGQEQVFAEQIARPPSRAEVRAGIEEQLKGWSRAATPGGHLCGDGGDIPATLYTPAGLNRPGCWCSTTVAAG